MYLVFKWLPFYIIYALKSLFFFPMHHETSLGMCIKKICNNIKNNNGKRVVCLPWNMTSVRSTSKETKSVLHMELAVWSTPEQF